MAGVVGILRVYAQAAGFLSGCLTILCFFVHFFNPSKGSMVQCGTAASDALLKLTGQSTGVSCIGPYLRIGSLDDINEGGWRKTFTLKPDDFVDLWTPLVFGAVQLVQHINDDMRIDMFSSNWLKVILFNVICALWGQFGYAGTIGVITGFLTTCAFLPFALVLMFIDDEKDEKNRNATCLNLGTRLGIKACQDLSVGQLTQRKSGASEGGNQEAAYNQEAFSSQPQRGSAAQANPFGDTTGQMVQ